MILHLTRYTEDQVDNWLEFGGPWSSGRILKIPTNNATKQIPPVHLLVLFRNFKETTVSTP